MHHPTDRISHTTAFVTPVVEHWLEREIIIIKKGIYDEIRYRPRSNFITDYYWMFNVIIMTFVILPRVRKEGNVLFNHVFLFTVIWRWTYGKRPFR